MKEALTGLNWWSLIRRMIVLVLGALIASLSYVLFQVPFKIAAGGVGGISIIVNHYTGWPVGTLYLVMNVPLLILGFFTLGRWRFLSRTVIGVAIFSLSTDFFVANLPRWLGSYPVTDDILLSAIYGGIVGGIGGGLIYRSGGTMGGTGIIGRVLQMRTGAPLSQVYFYTDGFIILTAGVIFGWEVALYALLALFMNGVASDYALEGPSSVRTATIITDQPEALGRALIERLGRGVSSWAVTGAYTGEDHCMLLCTIYRPQVNDLKRVVAEVDPSAFVVIGTAHQALGYGFTPLRRKS